MSVFNAAFSDGPVKAETTAPDVKAEVKDETPVADEVEEAVTSETAEPSSAKEEKPEAEKPKEPSERDEQGRFVKMVPHEALHAERKRHEAEQTKRIAAETELAQLRQTQQKPQPTSVLEDEAKARAEIVAEAQNPLLKRLATMSIALAKRAPGREDYQEIFEYFDAESVKDPSLLYAIDPDDPGESIYKLGKARRLAQEINDPVAYEAKLVAPYQQRLSSTEAENKALKAEIAALRSSKEKRDAIPESLNSEPSGSVKGDSFSGPTPLRSLFTS